MFLPLQAIRVLVKVLARGVPLALAGVFGGCGSSDSRPPYEREVKSWLCCAATDGTECECGGAGDGVAVDCFAELVLSCPTTSCCVVQQTDPKVWSCQCFGENETCPSGTGMYEVEQCPPGAR